MWWGYLISTVLLFWLRRKSNGKSSSDNEQKPSDFTETNVNQIGSTIPVVIGRGLIKNPLISYYGDFESRPYTEEYGMHTNLDAKGLLWPILLSLIPLLRSPVTHKANKTMKLDAPAVSTSGGEGQVNDPTVSGYVVDNDNGKKNAVLTNAIVSLLIALLLYLFTKHLGRTTIQKGFLYYLGWQHIICWTGENIGIKRIWMNVYDANLEVSTTQGVWGGDSIAWKNDNLTGIIAHIDDDQMFGGYDEGGGFIGDIRIYFGTQEQGRDSWMVGQMQAESIPDNLKGLTPKYPMFMTAVISGSSNYTPQPDPPTPPEPEKTPIIVVIGDSISAGVPYSDNKPSLAEDLYSWTHTYRELSGYDVINSAIGGDTSDGMLARFYEDVVNYHPDYVFIETGGNDYTAHGNDMNYLSQTKKNIDVMIRICEENDIKMRFITPIMRLNMPVSEDIQEHRAYTIAIKDYIESLGFSTTPYYDPLDEIPGILNYDYMADAVHPNLAGYKLVGEFIYEHLGDLPISSDPYEPEPAPAKDYNEVAGGAYIGKQSTVPDMWFEVVNYPDRLSTEHSDELWKAYIERITEQWQDITNYGAQQSQEAIDYVMPEYTKLTQDGVDYINGGSTTLDTLKQDWTDLYNKWPSSTRGEFYNVAYPLYQTFEHGPYTLGRQGDDCNPAEVIYEILTNVDWGCNYTDDRIDLISLIKLGIGCEQEEIGISCVFSQVSSCASYITKILNHIGAMMYDDITTGKLAFKLVRADYVVQSLRRFDMSNSVSLKFTRLDWSETSSSVNASFIDASNKYEESTLTVHDFANVLITKNNVDNEQDGTYFTTPQNAYNFAMRQLLTAAYPLASIELVCNRLAYNVTIGEPICITWEPYGIVNQVFRVTNVDYGTLTSGQIRITAVEDVYGFANTQYNYANPIIWTDPDKTPTRITRFKFIEAPYELTMNLNTYIYAFAAKPSGDVVYWHTWRTINNEHVKTNQSQVFSMIGRTVSGYDEYYGIDEQGFEIIALGYNGIDLFTEKAHKIEDDPYTFNNRNANCLLIMDEEIMSYNSIEILPNGNFQIKGVVRGLYDTLPKDHTTESMVYFIEASLSVSSTAPVCREGYTSTERLGVTSATVQLEQTLEPDLMVIMETVRRSESPNVMANLKFGTDNGPDTLYAYEYIPEFMLSGDLLFKYIVRNKFRDNSVRSQLDETVIPVEQNIKNYIRVICGAEDFITYFDTSTGSGVSATNITDIRMLWSWFCENMIGKIELTNYINIHVGTYNTEKNLYSIQEYVKENIKYVVPKIVGIVSDIDQVQAYANSLLFYDNNSVIVPPSSVNPQLAFTKYECPIILVGGVSGDTRYPKGQDGLHHAISPIAYRILTYQPGNIAVLGQVELKDYTVLASRFTNLADNYIQGYRYLGGEMTEYAISNS